GLTFDSFGTNIGVSAERPGHAKAEPIGVSSMCVPVVRDCSHFKIQREGFVAKSRLSSSFELVKHVRDLSFARVDAMRLPDGHWYRTDFAVGDPTRFVLMVPMSKTGGLAQITRSRGLAALGLLCGIFRRSHLGGLSF
ncbi:MAG: hypothetical protein ACI9TF_000235, partial [Paracrocinitomix sp.]